MSDCKDCIHNDVCKALEDKNGVPKVGSLHCGFLSRVPNISRSPARQGLKCSVSSRSAIKMAEKRRECLEEQSAAFRSTKTTSGYISVICPGLTAGRRQANLTKQYSFPRNLREQRCLKKTLVRNSNTLYNPHYKSLVFLFRRARLFWCNLS